MKNRGGIVMYLYIAFLKEDYLSRGKFYLKGEQLDLVKSVFPDYTMLNTVNINGCIGFIKGVGYREKKCYALQIEDIVAKADFLSLSFKVIDELAITNEFINKSLYKFARQSGWINKDNPFYPLVCVFQKKEFDEIRKGTPNTKKVSSTLAKLEELKRKKDWQGICNMYEPLEEFENKGIWNNSDELYEVAYAASKLGEPKNGLEKNEKHLSVVKRYRELSIKFYQRCCDLQPNNYRYFSAVAYRYYQNVMELTKPKGRRDGKVLEEIKNAIFWFDKALILNPKSIKDSYRKGKLILDKQINYLKFNNNLTKKDFQELYLMEKTGVECLEKAIQQYEQIISENQKKFYLNEYIKSLYTLGCYYIDKVNITKNEYGCRKLLQLEYINSITKEEMNYIAKARELLEKCFKAEDDFKIDKDISMSQLARISRQWAIPGIDKYYRLGSVYLYMFFVKLTKQGIKEITYGNKGEKYLNTAILLGEEYRKLGISGRSTAFVKEKLAWYYILTGEYPKAVKLLENLKDGYIRNTYVIALMLSDLPDKFTQGELVLNEAILDKNNKTKDLSKVLLAYLYFISGQKDKYNSFLIKTKDGLNKSAKELILLLENGEVYAGR